MSAVQEYEAVIREHCTEEEGVDKNSPDWHQVPFFVLEYRIPAYYLSSACECIYNQIKILQCII